MRKARLGPGPEVAEVDRAPADGFGVADANADGSDGLGNDSDLAGAEDQRCGEGLFGEGDFGVENGRGDSDGILLERLNFIE